MSDLRDLLTANIEASENGTLGQVADAPAVEASTEQTTQAEDQRARDEKGRFASSAASEGDKAATAEDATKSAPEVQAPSVDASVAPQDTTATPQDQAPQVERPASWKKEFQPVWEKLNSGAPLTPDESKKLAAYSAQREREFANGISQYKAVADGAKHLTDAVEPYSGLFQQYNVHAPTLIKSMCEAHKILALGSPEEKLSKFAQLAQDYGIPLNAVSQHQQGTLDPAFTQMMQHIQSLEQKVSDVSNWRSAQEQTTLQSQIAKFQDATKYPYFEQVRNEMASLFEKGVVTNLDDAYQKAVRLNGDVYQTELERMLAERQAKQQPPAVNSPPSKVDAVKAAKAAAVSPRTVTPSGATKPADPKDLRSTIYANFESAIGGRM